MSPDYKCEIFIRPNARISDPQGDTIRRCLEQLGFEGILSLRMGRELSFNLSAPNIKEARKLADEIAKAPLNFCTNPVTEIYTTRVTRTRKKP